MSAENIEMTELIKKLIKIPSVSGRESALAKLIQNEITPYVDDSFIDPLGNVIGFRRGTSQNPKNLMLAAHMDEIGFMVTYIEDNGFIRVTSIGGINYASAAFSTVVFENGVTGILVPEAQIGYSDFRAEKVYIDIGTSSRKETEKKISIGDTAVVTPSLTKLSGRRYAGRPMDDKLGCAVIIEACRQTANESCPNNTYFVFTVQEEVGCRGSKTAAYNVKPDFSIAYDVTGTGDSQNARPMAVKIGEGTAVKFKDSSVICDVRFAKLMIEVAKNNNIPYQREILESGGTDTSSMQMTGAGSVAGAISVPNRYIHSSVELFDMKDFEACVKLTNEMLKLDLGEAYSAL